MPSPAPSEKAGYTSHHTRRRGSRTRRRQSLRAVETDPGSGAGGRDAIATAALTDEELENLTAMANAMNAIAGNNLRDHRPVSRPVSWTQGCATQQHVA